MRPDLSIIILSYNTRDLLSDCLSSLKKVSEEIAFEVIVVDNGSTDGSMEEVKEKFQGVKIIDNKRNLGFAKGNNSARDNTKGKYVLFLNSDTVVGEGVLKKSLKFAEKTPDMGAMTCKLVLANGNLDRDARRRFPTPWISFKRLILGATSEYWYQDVPDTITQEVDAIQGAFFLSPKAVLDKVNWFSEDYFLDGEDIDLCWKIREAGYKIFYYPEVSVLHLKGASKGKKDAAKNVPLSMRLKFRMASVNSMEIFYKKWMWKRYPLIVNFLVVAGINVIKARRFFGTLLQ
jgi:GT2 family glycosyltransferase